jgi:hypothetical protein
LAVHRSISSGGGIPVCDATSVQVVEEGFPSRFGLVPSRLRFRLAGSPSKPEG